MIYSRPRYYVCCDKCGKTIEIKAADEKIASETAERQGWFCNTILRFSGVYKSPQYVNLCPKCKEEKDD